MSNTHVKTTAVFNGVDFKISHYWQLVLGGRYTRDNLQHPLSANKTASFIRPPRDSFSKSLAEARDGYSLTAFAKDVFDNITHPLCTRIKTPSFQIVIFDTSRA
jgi:hypothetical protein